MIACGSTPSAVRPPPEGPPPEAGAASPAAGEVEPLVPGFGDDVLGGDARLYAVLPRRPVERIREELIDDTRSSGALHCLSVAYRSPPIRLEAMRVRARAMSMVCAPDAPACEERDGGRSVMMTDARTLVLCRRVESPTPAASALCERAGGDGFPAVAILCEAVGDARVVAAERGRWFETAGGGGGTVSLTYDVAPDTPAAVLARLAERFPGAETVDELAFVVDESGVRTLVAVEEDQLAVLATTERAAD